MDKEEIKRYVDRISDLTIIIETSLDKRRVRLAEKEIIQLVNALDKIDDLPTMLEIYNQVEKKVAKDLENS